jgi:hypothetical protein
MNKISKNSELNQLTDSDLAGVSGGKRKIDMKPVTIVVFTEGSTIHGTPAK